MTSGNSNSIIGWILRLIVAGILFQTLFFKFSGAKESVYIFTTLGAEPWGRIGSGIVELIAVLLLLVPRTVAIGAFLSFGVGCGAVMSHLTKLGIKVINSDGSSDGGLLFGLALSVLVGSAVTLYMYRSEIPIVGPILFPVRG